LSTETTPVPFGPSRSVAVALLPIMAAVLTGFLVIGIALPVLPIHVNRDLGFGTFVVGLVAGAQFVAAVATRIWSGSYADTHGGKRAVLLGLVTAAASGLLYLLASASERSPTLSVAILLAGRALLGGAESFIITGGVSWGLALVEPHHAGKVIAWIGTAMLAALALGDRSGRCCSLRRDSRRSGLARRSSLARALDLGPCSGSSSACAASQSTYSKRL
jgi:MFS family permease